MCMYIDVPYSVLNTNLCIRCYILPIYFSIERVNGEILSWHVVGKVSSARTAIAKLIWDKLFKRQGKVRVPIRHARIIQFTYLWSKQTGRLRVIALMVLYIKNVLNLIKTNSQRHIFHNMHTRKLHIKNI